MTLYPIRGLQFHGVPPRNPRLSGHYLDSHSPPSSSRASEVYGDDEEDEEEDDHDCMGPDSDVGSGSVGSVPSPRLYRRTQVGLTSEEYAEYLEGGILPQDLITPGVGSGSDSGSGSRHSLAFVLPELGLADSDLSDPQDFLGAVDSDNESHGGEDSHSGSDGELSNVNSIDIEDDELGVHSYCDEVAKPPQLPRVCEERLQEVWPLGDASFNIFLCPITHDIMRDPVVGADGYTYERSAIARWFETSCKSPVTGQTLPHTELVPNHSVRTLLKMMIDMTEPPERPAEEAKDTHSQVVGQASASSSAAGLVVQGGDSSGMVAAVAMGNQKQLPSSASMASSGCVGASYDSAAAGTSVSPAAAATAVAAEGSPEAAAAVSAAGKRSSSSTATPTTPVLL